MGLMQRHVWGPEGEPWLLVLDRAPTYISEEFRAEVKKTLSSMPSLLHRCRQNGVHTAFGHLNDEAV